MIIVVVVYLIYLALFPFSSTVPYNNHSPKFTITNFAVIISELLLQL